MEILTKYDALAGELEPYAPSRTAILKALADAGVGDLDGAYNPADDKRPIAIAAVAVLKRMIVLTSDSLGKSSQGYNVDMLRKRIKDICNENGLDASEFVEIPTITDGSNLW